MSKQRDIEQSVQDISQSVGDKARGYASDAIDATQDLIERGRKKTRQLRARREDYTTRVAHYLEDAADEAHYHYRRAKRHVKRHPVSTVAIVAGTIGALLAVRHLVRSRNEED
ncbi:hypothetical protein ACYJW8_11325 [Frateuria aurantia]